MPRVDDSEFKAFLKGLEETYQRIGGGKIAVDSASLKALVRGHRAAAFRFVELHCEAAQSQPGYLQPALIVATAYHTEFGDPRLIQMVKERAGELGTLAAEEIGRIQPFIPAGEARDDGRSPASVGSRAQRPPHGHQREEAGTSIVAVFERLLQGRCGPEDISAWVEQVRSRYQRPDFAQMRQSAVTDLSWYEWDDDQRTLVAVLQQVGHVAEQLADQEPDKAAAYAHGVFLACPLLVNDEIGGKLAARAGFVLANASRALIAADALTYSVAALDRWGEDLPLTIEAASVLCKVLLEARLFDRAISVGKALAEQARAMGLRGHQAIALHAAGFANAELGRSEGLDQLREATDLRRVLSQQEAADQSVAYLASYLGAYGTKARDAGQLENALGAFLEMADVSGQCGDAKMHAYALSEVGDTFLMAGDDKTASSYLLQAADAGRQAGLNDGPSRWQTVAARLQQSSRVPSGSSGAATEETAKATPDHLQVPQLVSEGQFEAALALEGPILAAAEASKNNALTIECLNNIGVCQARLGRRNESIRSFQRGIQLADGLGHLRASLDMRQNLAGVYIAGGEYEEAHRVLLVGIAYALLFWDANATTGLREQIIASTVSLYESTALISTLGKRFDNALAVAELARARNTYQWMVLESLVQDARLSSEDERSAEAAIKDLLAVEVETDVRYLSAQVPVGEARRLAQRRSAARHAVEAALPGQDGAVAAFTADPHIYQATERAVAATVNPGTAILSLFSLPDHLNWALLHHDGDQIATTGGLVEWPREEREHATEIWQKAQQQALVGHGDFPAALDRFVAAFEERLLTPLASAIASTGARQLCVLPNAELALLPYWPLADSCPAVESLVIAPSLAVLYLCTQRTRLARGQTVVIPDRTNSLDLSPLEMSLVRDARDDHPIHEPLSVRAFHEVAASCTLLHVTGHGIFNIRNPYYSGFLISRGEDACEIFTQYLPEPGSGLVGRPTPWAIRLFTVAECLAELSLPRCRLAVLSACESGVPRIHAGGELTGLPNALLVSGAKSVIATLWPTNEGAAAALLHYFYQIWEGGSGNKASVAEALMTARKKLAKADISELRRILGPDAEIPPGDSPYSHPLYRDAFQCFGSW